jgi:hypothetical protein
MPRHACQSVTTRRDRGKDGRGGKASRKPKGTLRETAQQHKPTQNTSEVKKAALEYTPTETEKNNNHAQQKPEQAMPCHACINVKTVAGTTVGIETPSYKACDEEYQK